MAKKLKNDTVTPKLNLFDHVKHIRQVQNPNYYKELSDENKKTFNHFMILRALSMDEEIVEDMADLYQFLNIIPSEQFYTLLLNFCPKSNRFFPWIKSQKLTHNKLLLKYVAMYFKVPYYQANEYINLLLRTDVGNAELVNICKSYGLSDLDVDELFKE